MLKKYKGLTNSEKKLEKIKKISAGIFYPYVFRHIKNVNHLQKNQKKKKGAKKMINNKTDIIGYIFAAKAPMLASWMKADFLYDT